MLRKRILLLIPLFSLIYFFFRGQKPYSFHHTKAVFEGKETAKEEFERIFATSLKDFDFFYQLDFTAQRLRLLPKLGEQEHRKAYEIMFPWLRKDNFEMQRAKGRFDGSGVVMVVNNINVRKAYTTIRNLDNSTEVQLFYLGAHELSPSHFKLLKSTQATLVNLFSEFPLLEKYSNTIDFAPFAILASTLEHIIYIEAGSILLTNPEQLSLEHEYQRYGVLFFKDANTKFSEKDNDYFHFAMAHMDAIFEPGYKIANPVVGRESVFYQNPSFLMIDKVRGYSGLRAVCSLMLTSAGQSKFLASEVFWVVFEAIGSEYGFYPNYPKALLDTSVDGYTDYDKVYFDSKGKLIWMSGDFVEKKLFKQDDGAIYLPSSIKLAEIRSLVRFDRIGTAVLPFNIYSLTTRQMKSIISVGTTTIEAYETYERSRSQPKQISPWSYKSLPCKPTTAKSAFSEWISERIDFWNSLDELFLRQKQHELYEFMRKLNSTTSSYSGMGIIYSCHPGIIKNTVISIQIVRKLGCNLPIELWHMNELNTTHTKYLEKFENVKVFNLAKASTTKFKAGDDDHKLYQVKAGALLYSKLEKILFLDSDNTPVKDPTFLFTSAPLVETGAIFWKDLWKTRPDNPIFKILDIPCVDEYDQESGQIVIDKSFTGVTKALQLSLFFQERSDLYYRLLLGDKDTFRLSWRLLSLPFHMVRPHLGTLGSKLHGKPFCGIAMAQYAPFWEPSTFGPYPDGYTEPAEPELLFVHANLLKYTKLGEERVFETIKHYSPPAPLDGVGIFMTGPCISLADIPESKVVTTNNVLKEYEEIYRSITAKVSKEVEGEFGKL